MASTPHPITSFEAFWPFYVSQHSDDVTRFLHYLGTFNVLALAGASIFYRAPGLVLAMPFAGYSFSWIGHFFFEQNKPATWTYPMWSLLSDFKMFGYMLTGRMQGEVDKYGVKKA